ncbi:MULTISPECIES: trypsin-like serine peptidase [unclassified Kribbella]|uniref:trypsin-like serine peptidase n=1 Tax=unclassified Kribbella TaxID=2644121 RepID=UPI00301AD69A
MMRFRPAFIATLCAVGLVVPLTGTATAAPTAKPSPVYEQATTKAEQAKVRDFWTPERMKSAVPIDRLLKPKQGLAGKVAAAGKPTTVAPTAFPNGGGQWTGGGKIVSTEGRVFFTYQGRTASCSGTAVTSTNESTVITAGHCVKLDGAFHTNWVFVPAYNNGSTPYGTWTAKKTYATPQWVASEDINYDVGAAAVNPLNGQNLTDVVGGQGIAFNQARGQNMYAFGYPAAAPYDGSKLIYCSGSTFDAFISDGIGMTCDMTGGSSGGGWFLQFSESTGAGIVNSVNSYKINFIPTWMFGPYFGTDAQNVYNTAQAG